MTTLFKQFPIAEKRWADNKDSNKYTIESKAIINWKCDKGHDFKKAINKFVVNQDCPVCKKQGNRLTNNPKAVSMWDYKKNDVDIHKVSLRNNKAYWWLCDKGHSFRMQCDRINDNEYKCPYCDMDTLDKHPELLKQFDFDNNPNIDIHYTSCNSKLVANWKCPNCGYTWKSQINSRHSKNGRCPCCDEKSAVQAGYNDIFSLYPELRLDFNDDYDTSSEGVSSTKKAKWKCHICNYEWETTLTGRIKNGKINKCPACANIVRTKSYAEQYPELLNYYSPNNIKPLTELVTGQLDRKKYLWICDKHGEYEQYLSAQIRGLKTKYNGCPYCAGKKVKKEESFGYVHPELVKEYSPENKESIFEVSLNSDKEAIWQCECGNKWTASFRTRHQGFGKCRKCNPYSNYEKMLADERPDLESYYQDERNFNTYAVSSNKSTTWECENGHRFNMPVYKMTRYSTFTCPICEGIRLEQGVNDFESNYPELSKEWSINNERKPSETIKTTNHAIKWICKDCGYEYLAKLQEKINGFSCPVCDNRTTVKGINDLATTHPLLVNEYSKANTRDITTIRKDIEVYVLWTCPDCHNDYQYMVKYKEAGDKICPFCNNKRVKPGFNDLLTVEPELAERYCINNELPANRILASSPSNFRWNCNNCGGEYPATISQIKEGYCPFCNNERVLSGFNDLATKYPELVEKYTANNPKPASEILYTNQAYYEWQCDKCGGIYNASLQDVKDGYCPYCEDKKVLQGKNDLVTFYPEIAKLYSSNNEKPANQVLYTLAYTYNWVCDKCNGEFSATIEEVNNGYCPYCENKRVLTGKNDFKTMYPHLVNLYSNDNVLPPNRILYTSGFYYKWQCDKCGGDFNTSIDRLDKEGCPYCNDIKVLTGKNDLKTMLPDLVKMYSNNNEIPADEVLYVSNNPFEWQCTTCNGEFKTTINNLKERGCPYCNNRRALTGLNDITTIYPNIAKLYSQNNERIASEVLYTNIRPYIWNCDKCGGEYKATITEVNDGYCPYCEDKKVLTGKNDLKTMYPELAKRYSTHNEKQVDQVLYLSKGIFSWECKTCGGEYNATIEDARDEECPYCENRKVLKGLNDLTTTHPQLVEEWGLENYLIDVGGPENYKFDSTKNVYWLCPKCGTHYRMNIDDRVINDKRHHEPCWKCNGRMKNILKL